MTKLFRVIVEGFSFSLSDFEEGHDDLQEDVLTLLCERAAKFRLGTEKLKQLHGFDHHFANLSSL